MTVERQTVLITGVTGFIGSELYPALLSDGHNVRAGTRRPLAEEGPEPQRRWVECDLLRPETLGPALDGAHTAYYLVHSMGRSVHYRKDERYGAEAFARAAERAGLSRIVYLGGVLPQGLPSEHLASRLHVGEILRSAATPAIELRASMIIGNGSASWRIVRDLALRLPVMIWPRWLRSRTRPIALRDTILALRNALTLPIINSQWYDIPGPDTLSGKEVLQRIAALRGRRVPAIEVPMLTPRLSAMWLKLISNVDYDVARELVLGLSGDLLPQDERYFHLTLHKRRLSFDEAALRALDTEHQGPGLTGILAALEERIVDRLGPAS